MSEEVKDSSATLPRALLWSFTFNALLGFIMAVTLVFTLGNVDEVLASLTGEYECRCSYADGKSPTGLQLTLESPLLGCTDSH